MASRSEPVRAHCASRDLIAYSLNRMASMKHRSLDTVYIELITNA